MVTREIAKIATTGYALQLAVDVIILGLRVRKKFYNNNNNNIIFDKEFNQR